MCPRAISRAAPNEMPPPATIRPGRRHRNKRRHHMSHNAIETVLGAVVLAVAAIFLVFAMGAADLHKVSGYNVWANFSKAEGIAPGLDVRISGVKIGSVEKAELDPKTYL